MFLWREFETSSQGFPSKHVKISISSVLIHKYILQQSFLLKECDILAELIFFFHLFCSSVVEGSEWTGQFPRLKLNMILQHLSSWKFCECVCNYCDRVRM